MLVTMVWTLMLTRNLYNLCNQTQVTSRIQVNGTANRSLLESLPRRTYTPGAGGGKSTTYRVYFGVDG